MIETAGEARRLAGNDERAAAIFAVSRVLWLTAWEETVSAVTRMVVQQVTADIDREADRVSMPPKVREKCYPTASERRSLAARLGSAGTGLVPVLDELDRRGEAALAATALDRPALEEWHDALRMAARRLENAWLLLEDRTETEVSRWKPVVEQVARWRKPVLPVLIVTGLALAAATWLGLALGGFIPAPAFLQPLIDLNQ
jgi:hypothetical protein